MFSNFRQQFLRVLTGFNGNSHPPEDMNKIVPRIGSAEVGPLAILYLPCLWLSSLLPRKDSWQTGIRRLAPASTKR
jgi:hypothetical protein